LCARQRSRGDGRQTPDLRQHIGLRLPVRQHPLDRALAPVPRESDQLVLVLARKLRREQPHRRQVQRREALAEVQLAHVDFAEIHQRLGFEVGVADGERVQRCEQSAVG
jgi:hypothetical protein